MLQMFVKCVCCYSFVSSALRVEVQGVCQCDAGWTGPDCSHVDCLDRCSSSEDDVRGVCVPDFPAHQCHCLGRYAGLRCEKVLGGVCLVKIVENN